MSDRSVPRAWRVITNSLADAQIASRMMTNNDLPEDTRQTATRRYVRSSDQVIAELAELRKAGVLDAIAEFLAQRYRD